MALLWWKYYNSSSFWCTKHAIPAALLKTLLLLKPSRQQTPLNTHECFPCESDYENNLLFVCLFSIKAAYFHTTFLGCLITAPNTCIESGRPPPSRLSLRVWPGFDSTIRERSGSPCWLFMFCYGIIQCCSIEIRVSIVWGIVYNHNPSERSALERQLCTKPLHDY